MSRRLLRRGFFLRFVHGTGRQIHWDADEWEQQNIGDECSGPNLSTLLAGGGPTFLILGDAAAEDGCAAGERTGQGEGG